MCDVFCSFFSSYNCLWFELSEVFKDFQFEADLPSSAPVYVLFWLDGLSLFDFLGMSVSLGFVPIWVKWKDRWLCSNIYPTQDVFSLLILGIFKRRLVTLYSSSPIFLCLRCLSSRALWRSGLNCQAQPRCSSLMCWVWLIGLLGCTVCCQVLPMYCQSTFNLPGEVTL